MDLCHKKFEYVCQPLDEGHLMEDILYEQHHFTGSLKEDREKLMASMNNLVDINALVERCYRKDYEGEMEGESLLEECIALKEGLEEMKESYMNLLSDRDNLLMVTDMYHCSFKKET